MNPLISVIIPSYKAENYITETVNAVLAQSYSPIEIIVIDDGSPCNQAKVIQELDRLHENVKYIYQENAGVSAARNHGLKISKGDYIAFLDADDVWLPENLMLKFQKLQGIMMWKITIPTTLQLNLVNNQKINRPFYNGHCNVPAGSWITVYILRETGLKNISVLKLAEC